MNLLADTELNMVAVGGGEWFQGKVESILAPKDEVMNRRLLYMVETSSAGCLCVQLSKEKN